MRENTGGKIQYAKFVFLLIAPVVTAVAYSWLPEYPRYFLFVIVGVPWLYIASLVTPLLRSRKSLSVYDTLPYAVEQFVEMKVYMLEARDIIGLGSFEEARANRASLTPGYLTKFDEVRGGLALHSARLQREVADLQRLDEQLQATHSN